VTHLTTTAITAVTTLEPEEWAGYMDREMRRYIFELAAKHISGFVGGQLAGLSEDGTSAFATWVEGLVWVVIAGAAEGSDAAKAAAVDYVTSTIQNAVVGLVPNCAPEWLHGMADGVVGIVVGSVAGGSTDELNAELAGYLNQTAESGRIPGANGGPADLGTCHAVVGDDAPGPGGQCVVDPTARSANRRSAQSCAGAEQFAQWLKGLSTFEIDAAISIESSGATVTIGAVDPGLGFDAYRLVVANDEAAGLVTGRNMAGASLPTGVYVGVSRNAAGVVVGFGEAAVDDVFAVVRAGLASVPGVVETIDVILRAVDGCAAAIGENIDAFKQLFIDYWNAESNWEYLRQKWQDIQEIAIAFAEDPDGFLLFILADTVRADEYGADKAAWAGALTCDLLLALLTGGGAAATGRFARLLSERGLADVRAWRDGRLPNVCGSRSTTPAPRSDCVIDATSYFPARVDTRYAGPAAGREAFRVSARRTSANATLYEMQGRVLESVSTRRHFESSNYPTNADLGLPSTYDRSHLVGPGGFGQESGQILYATRNFNRGFMQVVEQQMQAGFAIAAANGWTMRFAITAESHPNDVHSGAVLRQISYEAWFEKPGVEGRFPYLDAFGLQSAPRNGQPGETLSADPPQVYTDFSTPVLD
jgi:hypothetical protein